MSNDTIEEVYDRANRAKNAVSEMASASADRKNTALKAIARLLGEECEKIVQANAQDLIRARQNGMAEAMVDRLALSPARIRGMAQGVLEVSALQDPIGSVLGGQTRPNGLQITKLRVPLGVIGIIFESRPNVTVDAASLCIKSGNCAVLRGGSEAIESNVALSRILSAGLRESGLPGDAIQLIETTDRAAVKAMLTLNGVIDCVIPRGGASLIRTVVETATVPVIETGTGNCHIYVDKAADIEMASKVILNAKTSRPSVCNAVETVLIHADIAAIFAPELNQQLAAADVEIRADERAEILMPGSIRASESDWHEEYSALILAVKIVDSEQEAIKHIGKYGTKHSEAIITGDYAAAQLFCDRVDAAAVYVNASTRFTDGHRFGMGAEIGISNQKLHARGPMGLEELTTYKYIVRGNGQTV